VNLKTVLFLMRTLEETNPDWIALIGPEESCVGIAMHTGAEPMRRITGPLTDRRTAIVKTHYALVTVLPRRCWWVEWLVVAVPHRNEVTNANAELGEPGAFLDALRTAIGAHDFRILRMAFDHRLNTRKDLQV
jgi:hypothetical protein